MALETEQSNADIVTALRQRACPAGLPWTADNPQDDHGHTDCWLQHQAANEIERLRRWKAEAAKVLARWDDVADLVPTGANQLGLHKYDIVANELRRLRALITAWADADDYDEPESDDAYYKAWFALRKAVGR